MPNRVRCRWREQELRRSRTDMLRFYSNNTNTKRVNRFQTNIVDMQAVIVSRSIDSQGYLNRLTCIFREIQFEVSAISCWNGCQCITSRVSRSIAPNNQILFVPCNTTVFRNDKIELLIVRTCRGCRRRPIGKCRIKREANYRCISDLGQVNTRRQQPRVFIRRIHLNTNMCVIAQSIRIIRSTIPPSGSSFSRGKREFGAQDIIKCQSAVLSPVGRHSRCNSRELFNKRQYLCSLDCIRVAPSGSITQRTNRTHINIVCRIAIQVADCKGCSIRIRQRQAAGQSGTTLAICILPYRIGNSRCDMQCCRFGSCVLERNRFHPETERGYFLQTDIINMQAVVIA